MEGTNLFTWSHGAVVRGSRKEPRMALVFTGGHFGEGTTEVLNALAAHRIPGSFFFTGGFLRAPGNGCAISRIVDEGHQIGPHSDAHLLYCPWAERGRTLVSREEFLADLNRNLDELARYGVDVKDVRWWIPPYEWYNETVAQWARDAGRPLFNFTPGTVSHTDYTEASAANYRSSDTIYRNILEFESGALDGLNGFLLLTHVGAGPGRPDKFFRRLPTLIEVLKRRGYSFVTVDALLAGALEGVSQPGGVL